MKNIGVLTSGGDSPGMNAAIRAVCRTALYQGVRVFGIYDGYQGLIENNLIELQSTDVENIIHRGGTILGTARSKEFLTYVGRKKAFDNFQSFDLDGLIVIGGDGTYKGAIVFNSEFGIPINGLPGTIDNDIFGTDSTIGYDTALNTIVDAVDKIRDTATSHHRVFFVEVMGRHSGFIGLDAGIAVGADLLLIPETPTEIDELAKYLNSIKVKKRSSIILVSEGDEYGGAIDIMNKVKARVPDLDVRASILGHIQRGGNPSAYDRILASRLAVQATDDLLSYNYGNAYGVQGDNLVKNSLALAVSQKINIDLSKLKIIGVLSKS
jgi:6-phosphofructokinase 1